MVPLKIAVRQTGLPIQLMQAAGKYGDESLEFCKDNMVLDLRRFADMPVCGVCYPDQCRGGLAVADHHRRETWRPFLG